MAKKYITKYECEKCGKTFLSKRFASRCCRVIELRKSVLNRSYSFEVIGKIKPKLLLHALQMLGTCRSNVIGWYKWKLRKEPSDLSTDIVINITNEYILKRCGEPMPCIWDYDYYVVLKVRPSKRRML